MFLGKHTHFYDIMQSPRAIIMRHLRNSKHARRTRTPRSQL